MPIYEYLCKPCGEVYEEFFVSCETASQVITCPQCGGSAAKKPSNFTGRMFTEKMADMLAPQLGRRPKSYRDLHDLMGDGEIVSKQEWQSKIKREWDMDGHGVKDLVAEGTREAKEHLTNLEYVRQVNRDIIEVKNSEYLKGYKDEGSVLVPEKG